MLVLIVAYFCIYLVYLRFVFDITNPFSLQVFLCILPLSYDFPPFFPLFAALKPSLYPISLSNLPIRCIYLDSRHCIFIIPSLIHWAEAGVRDNSPDARGY